MGLLGLSVQGQELNWIFVGPFQLRILCYSEFNLFQGREKQTTLQEKKGPRKQIPAKQTNPPCVAV